MSRPAVLLDLDDTILDFHQAESHAISSVFRQLGIEDTEENRNLYSRLNLEQWKKLEKGEVTRPELKIRRFENLFRELNLDTEDKDINSAARKAARLYEQQLSQGHWFIAGAEEMLEELYPDYDLYLVSNGSAVVQKGRLDSAGIRPYFKEIFISENLGADKPSKEYFDLVFDQIPQKDKDKIVIIGDSLTSDILGGINAGIHTIWFNPKKSAAGSNISDIKPEMETDTLNNISNLLKIIFQPKKA